MTARDWFGVALRVLGVWFLVQAGADTIFLLLRQNEILDAMRSQITQDKLFIAFYVAVAFVTLVLTDHVVRLAYGPVATTGTERIS